LASGNEIRDVVSGVGESTVFPALTQLYQRKMVEREKVTQDGNWHHEYEVSKYGEAKLSEMGEPNSW
jgi:predicted transcriptional regulator